MSRRRRPRVSVLTTTPAAPISLPDARLRRESPHVAAVGAYLSLAEQHRRSTDGAHQPHLLSAIQSPRYHPHTPPATPFRRSSGSTCLSGSPGHQQPPPRMCCSRLASSSLVRSDRRVSASKHDAINAIIVKYSSLFLSIYCPLCSLSRQPSKRPYQIFVHDKRRTRSWQDPQRVRSQAFVEA